MRNRDMHIIEVLDSRIASMFFAIVVFLFIMTAIQRTYLPERKSLTLDDVRMIEEIRKITRYAQPEIEKPPEPLKKTVKPEKRIVKEQIQQKLSELRQKQVMNKVPQKRIIQRTDPKIDMYNPSLSAADRESKSRKDRKSSLGRLLSKSKMQHTDTSGPVIMVAKGPDTGDEYDTGGSIRDGIDTRATIGPGAGTEGDADIPVIPISPGITVEGSGSDNISVILHPLIEWMRKHPAEFTPVEMKFLEYVPGDLIARAHFTLENETFDLLLLFKQATTELRISLRVGSDVILLIDQGLQERSNYLREGEAATDTGGRVIAFGTSQKSASEEATEYFYQVFLSWWDWVQNK